MDRARMMADSCELPWFGVLRVVRIQDSFGGPNSHVAVYAIRSVTLFIAAHRVCAAQYWVYGPPAAVARRFPSGET